MSTLTIVPYVFSVSNVTPYQTEHTAEILFTKTCTNNKSAATSSVMSLQHVHSPHIGISLYDSLTNNENAKLLLRVVNNLISDIAVASLTSEQ